MNVILFLEVDFVKGRGKEADILSPEFKVAAEIFRFEKKGEKVWFTKLERSLGMPSSTLSRALRRLFDSGIVKAEFGETETGRAGRLLYIAGESRDVIEKIYERFWKDRE